MTIEVERTEELIYTSRVLTTLLHELSAITDYRTLRDSIPQRLTNQLQCHYVQLYFQHEGMLQPVANSFTDDGEHTNNSPSPHIAPINTQSNTPEAYAWRERKQIAFPTDNPTSVAVPLIYRQRSIGVLVV